MAMDVKLEKDIIKLAKKCKLTQYEIADKLGVRTNTVMNTMIIHGIMSLGKVEILVRNNAEKSAEELAEIAKVDVKRIRELLSIYKPIYERECRIVELAMELKPQSEIAKELHTTIPTVRSVMDKNGIMSLNELRNLMRHSPEKSIPEIARISRINIEAIKNLDVAQLSQTNRDIIKLAQEGKYSQIEIARMTGVSQPTVRRVILKSEIMTLEEIECLVSQNMEMSNEQLAGMAHVNVSAIEIARKKVEEKQEKEKEKANAEVKRTANETRREKIKETTRQEGINLRKRNRQTSKNIKVPKETRSKEIIVSSISSDAEPEILSIPEDVKRKIRSKLMNFPAVLAIAKEFGVSREVVEQIQQQIQQEKYDRTHTEVNFKIKRTNLLQKLRNINSNITDMTAQIIVQEADVLLNEFKQYLKTEQDYALIAYAYVKAREYSKAISIGEKYIGLEESSIGALKNRIKDIMLEQEQEVNIGNNKERSTENKERFI